MSRAFHLFPADCEQAGLDYNNRAGRSYTVSAEPLRLVISPADYFLASTLPDGPVTIVGRNDPLECYESGPGWFEIV